MPHYFAIYDWSLYTLPSSLPMSDIEFDTHANDPASATYVPAENTWIGPSAAFTYNGGAPTLIGINDDDGIFEDLYVETGTNQTLAQNVTINGTPFLAGSIIENEFSMVDGSGQEIWVVRIDGINVGFAYSNGEEPSPGDTFIAVTGRDGDPIDSGDGITANEPYALIACFTPGVEIDTPDGPRKVEDLRVGDLVETLDDGAKLIRWVSRRQVDFGAEPGVAKPVLIKAGAFGPAAPNRDLIISSQHRFLMQGQTEPHAGETLAAAKALTTLPKVREMKGKRQVDYVHFALDQHAIVFANNVPTESCYLGETLLADLSEFERARLIRLFPKIKDDGERGYGKPARPIVPPAQAEQLIEMGRMQVATGVRRTSSKARPKQASMPIQTRVT